MSKLLLVDIAFMPVMLMHTVVLLAHLIKHKSDVEQVFYNFQHHVEHLLNSKIRKIQSDWGWRVPSVASLFPKDWYLPSGFLSTHVPAEWSSRTKT